MIILHHCFFHSDIDDLMLKHPYFINTYLMSFLGIGGKVGVNIFFMITGYFMVFTRVKVSKVLNIILEVFLYTLLGICVFALVDDYFSNFTLRNILGIEFRTFSGIKGDFIGTWIMVYIISPFINVVCENINQKKFLILLTILFIYFCIFSLNGESYMTSYFSWGVSMYLVGAYIRLYPVKTSSVWLWLILIAGVMWLSTVYYLSSTNLSLSYLIDAYNYPNMLPIVLISVPFFILFTRLKMKYNRIINSLGAGAFAVYICHDVIYDCRRVIWEEIFDPSIVFTSPAGILYIILYSVSLYLVVATLDIYRRRYIERPLTKLFNRSKVFKFEY